MRSAISDVRDTVRGYALLMETGVPGMVYNVASGVARSIRGVLDALLPFTSAYSGGGRFRPRLRPLDTPVILGDASRLATTTGWTPVILRADDGRSPRVAAKQRTLRHVLSPTRHQGSCGQPTTPVRQAHRVRVAAVAGRRRPAVPGKTPVPGSSRYLTHQHIILREVLARVDIVSCGLPPHAIAQSTLRASRIRP